MPMAFFVLCTACRGPYLINPSRPLEPVQILCIVEHITCLIRKDVAGYIENKAGKTPTSKRKMNRKR